MKTAARFAVVSFLTFVALFGSGSSLAKGPSQATITGPGIATPIVVGDGSGSVLGTDLASLVEESGFFTLLWCRTCPQRLTSAPQAELGPGYTVTYTMTLPLAHGTRSDQVQQVVYPFASPRPVTYLRRGQPFWNGSQSLGGWFVAHDALRRELVRLGVRVGLTQPWKDAVVVHATSVELGIGGAIGIVAIAGVFLFSRRMRRRKRLNRSETHGTGDIAVRAS